MKDHIVRGAHGYDWTRTLFAVLRPLDVLFTYLILSYFNLASSPRHLVLATLIGLSALRQSYWAIALHPHPLNLALVIQVLAYNFILDQIWTLTACYALAAGPLGVRQYAAIALHLLGSFLETFSEIQRKAFKMKKENQGKLHTTGLFSIAQHINYTGYILRRVALGLATGSWIAFALSFHNLYDFFSRGVPLLQDYLAKRYGAQKTAYDTKTPSKLLPYVW